MSGASWVLLTTHDDRVVRVIDREIVARQTGAQTAGAVRIQRYVTRRGATSLLITAADAKYLHALVDAATTVGGIETVIEEQPRDAGDSNFAQLSTGDLLARTRSDLVELRRRGVLRTGNAPAGDYAEWLVCRATNGQLGPNSQRSWDVLTVEGERIQVKARMVTDPAVVGKRQLSVIRSWDFDSVVVVLFDDFFAVRKAARLPTELCEHAARFIPLLNGHRLMATDSLLARGEDWTDRLRQHANAAVSR